ncbi:hypothetical protein D3C80_1190900 [compost metagenome]
MCRCLTRTCRWCCLPIASRMAMLTHCTSTTAFVMLPAPGVRRRRCVKPIRWIPSLIQAGTSCVIATLTMTRQWLGRVAATGCRSTNTSVVSNMPCCICFIPGSGREQCVMRACSASRSHSSSYSLRACCCVSATTARMRAASANGSTLRKLRSSMTKAGGLSAQQLSMMVCR